ncbi:MAG: DUF4255 domain-containing protein [Zetaproteobacteria bacterium CG06_land_8_20_14_3_00_59_53]|nr:MAG: hypothetical protein AUK36_03485 [Zetaproteobacteria bacterium CG2_30_59_37]PIO89047.1 MAG: hypothetical protein COX56_10290 [Zetaproteobacteria bacterium CG23_combo_of_CG06-09_8_20_14_all_59_86]PIQ64408.1 MAG: hypothetical protein COV97_10370 [Zetaproteobacteria bacterium CG11_big_fil_rev_8_21_14_0_20_59_439]PIU70474.1 MAG: DUF4255 domain-containing protein [Zetaproteobacteria bacterium CG06_land_8_20_14_3_00_59_53]PIU97349.1 MAG: DUF4255 domain-containing protein [Zetaproteobacteria b
MIYSALALIVNQLNDFLKRSFDLGEDVVVLSNLMEQDGTLAQNVGNKLVVSLINVEKETSTSRDNSKGGAISLASSYPPLHLNLYVMVAANFSCANYAESLKFLSNAVAFFQRQPYFDHGVAPDMDRRISKLVLDVENLNVQDLSNLWGSLSGKYLPSVLYKVRMLSFDSGDILTQLTPIGGYESSVE